MIRTLIIDDEKNNRRKIRELLDNHFPNVQVVGEADGVKTGLEAIINNSPELVLLEDLKVAITKAESQLLKDLNLQLAELSNNLNASQNKRIVLRTVHKLHFIPINEIMRCEADRNYTTFFLDGSKKIVVSGSIRDYEDILCEQGFYRLHKSHIVNLSYIKCYEKADGGTVILSDGSSVPVAVRKKNQLIELFNNM